MPDRSRTTSPGVRAAGTGDPKFRMLAVGMVWPPETFIGNLLRGLAEAGAEVTVACENEPRAGWLPHARVRWVYAPTWKGPALTRLWRTSSAMARALAAAPADVRLFNGHVRRRPRWNERLRMWHSLLPFAGRRWDLIYFPWNTAAIAHLPLFDVGCPVIVSCRGAQVNIAPHNPRRASIRDGLSATFERAAAVHCVSDAVAREALRCGGLDERKVTVIRPAVDADFFRPPPRRAGGGGVLELAATGSLIWRKGFDYAVQAVRHLLDAGVAARLSIIGTGPERPRVLYAVEDLGLGDHVRLLGNLSPDGVRDRLQESDVFVLSSLSEGISNAALEAMACGLPVVTTDCGGMREAVADGVEGFVVPVRDARAMAEAVSVLAADPRLRRAMGDAARARVLRQFTVARQIEEFTALCLRTCRGGTSYEPLL